MHWIHKTATQQRAALERGEISALELLNATIAQLEAMAPYLNPVSTTFYDRARDAALAADKNLARGNAGPLAGIPITIKDSQWYAGEPCTHGSFSLQNFVPQQSSVAVERLEAAGAIIFAKTTCPEYCLSGTTYSALYGHTSNPWDLSKTPGGSSGGAAAAIAAGIGSMALGGDGGGSIRIPAAFCGITGFKPSFGVVPRKPGFPNWESLVMYGPMTRSVADAKLMFSVLTGKQAEQASSSDTANTPLSLIVSEDLGFAPLNDDVRVAFRAAIDKISTAGHTIKYDNPGLLSSVSTWAITATADMFKYKDMAQTFSPGDIAELGLYAQEFIKFGGNISDLDIEDAQLHRVRIHDAYVEMFRQNRTSIIVTPTLGCEAFSHGMTHPASIGATPITYPWLDWAGFLYDANLTGMPSCSIPMGFGVEGLPVSLHIMGPPGHDNEVLDAASIIEQLLEWKQPGFSVEEMAIGGYSRSLDNIPAYLNAPLEATHL
jgi:Asp-tRNA(Asn)/Glu-tRNA(Gln) amidotransferase A subunit family amidase